MSDSPLERWCAWIQSLPPEVADELALTVGAMLPGTALPAGIRPTEALVAQARSAARGPSGGLAGGKREAGLCLCLAALTDVVTDAQSDPETWAETRAMLEMLDQAAEEVLGADVGEFVERARLRTPLLSRQWKAAAESWSQLRKDALAASSITRWLRQRRLPPSVPT